MSRKATETEIVKSLRNVPGKTLLLLGNKGSGKSEVFSQIAGHQVNSVSSANTTSSETQEVRFVSVHEKGSKDNTVSLIDTVAFDPQDTKVNSKIIADLVNKLKSECDFVNLIGLCINGQDPSLDASHTSVLGVLKEVFGEGFWEHCLVIFTFCPGGLDDKAKGCLEKLEEQFEGASACRHLCLKTFSNEDDENLLGPMAELESKLETATPLRMSLRVLAYNVWGMPSRLGDKDKRVRMGALAEMFSTRLDFDLLLLSELWLQKDHELIRQKVAKKSGQP